MEERLLKQVESIVNQQLDLATFKLIIAIIALYLAKTVIDKYINNHFELQKNKITEFHKYKVSKKALIYEYYFGLIYELQTQALICISDPSLVAKANQLRPSEGNHMLYLDRKEVTLLNNIADIFIESQSMGSYNINETSEIIQELQKCFNK